MLALQTFQKPGVDVIDLVGGTVAEVIDRPIVGVSGVEGWTI